MRECEEKLKSVHSAGAHGWQVTKGGTRVKHIRELKSHANWSTTDKTSSLARQLVCGLDS